MKNTGFKWNICIKSHYELWHFMKSGNHQNIGQLDKIKKKINFPPFY